MASADSASSGSILRIADWTARFRITPSGKVEVDYVSPDGVPRTRLPTEARCRAGKAQLAAVKARVADIEGALKEARVRLEQTYRNGRDWSFDDWCARYRDHPLTRSLCSRLLWQFTPASGPTFVALGTAPALTSLNGSAIDTPASPCRVRLWHPLMSDPDARRLWRERLLESGVRQPFWQVFRPVYDLTPPERATATYSNRFAGLLLDQPVFVHVLRTRGWVLKSRMLAVPSDPARPARLMLPAFNLVAEYWGRGAGQAQHSEDGYGAPNFEYFATSQIRFYRVGEDSMAGAKAVPLTEVPPQAFGEAMFDIELATGIGAVGFDIGWHDPGADASPPPRDEHLVETTWNGDLTRQTPGELARMRAELLQWLVPRLAIAGQLAVDGHRLRVQGKWHEYEIHTANAAVRILGPNRHVCIVPRGRSAEAAEVPLPFAGDEVLALVLSKAHMLVAEDRIRDQEIIDQLR